MATSLKVIVRITDKCNQDCTYCYVDRETRLRTTVKLSLEKLARFYSQVLEGTFNHVHFVWHGGEPTLVGAEYLDHAVALQNHFKANCVCVENSMQTNATVLDDSMIEVIKLRSIGVGISLDAPPDVHDETRVNWAGRLTLTSVLKGVERLRVAGIHFGAICVLHRNNYQRVDEIYDYFKSIGLAVGPNCSPVRVQMYPHLFILLNFGNI